MSRASPNSVRRHGPLGQEYANIACTVRHDPRFDLWIEQLSERTCVKHCGGNGTDRRYERHRASDVVARYPRACARARARARAFEASFAKAAAMSPRNHAVFC